ncbi:hypothetical protein [Gynuella sunshinyii]|uniref:hypothetical protein n=1 Tax=Gynuella sunshinyii TaxID=1445505 RepID=UPI00147024FE|nr:hypothetical protein [Gynuella sunshinyii]
MRQILMSEPGEFKRKEQNDHVRSIAVKMLAKLIKKPDQSDDTKVVVSNKAIQRTSR